MPDFKPPKLPDRTPIKLSITISPDLVAGLNAYAAANRNAYGQEEPVTELIPAMLACLLDSDRSFTRRRAKA